MDNMSDIIEHYIKQLLSQAPDDKIELKRQAVAQKFDCVPSQLNYVIKTRFTREHGYAIESKRGGGGFIRISKVRTHDRATFFDHLIEMIGDDIKAANAENIVVGLLNDQLITLRERQLITNIINCEIDQSDAQHAGQIRARLLIEFLQVLKYNEYQN